jgi:hypothetical protein
MELRLFYTQLNGGNSGMALLTGILFGRINQAERRLVAKKITE